MLKPRGLFIFHGPWPMDWVYSTLPNITDMCEGQETSRYLSCKSSPEVADPIFLPGMKWKADLPHCDVQASLTRVAWGLPVKFHNIWWNSRKNLWDLSQRKCHHHTNPVMTGGGRVPVWVLPHGSPPPKAAASAHLMGGPALSKSEWLKFEIVCFQLFMPDLLMLWMSLSWISSCQS